MMITPSFGLTATERVLPKLALDFTTAALDSRITFTRTTGASNPATYVDSSGIITTATNNQPRFDHSPATLACKGLLIEESRTNLFLQSANASTTWNNSGSRFTLTINDAVAPDNTTSADKLLANSTSENRIDQTVTVTSGATVTVSTYWKYGNNPWVHLIIWDGSANGARQWFNIQTGAVGTKTAFGSGFSISSATIEPAANGFYRIVATAVTTGTTIRGGFSIDNGDGQTAATVNNFNWWWGAQLEAGAFATSYIPTTTTALTRNADVATMTGTNFSDWFNAGNGAFGCSVLPKAASGVKPVLQCDDATALNTIVMQGNATATEMKITTLAVLQNTLSTGTITANAQYGLCGAWSAGSDALSENGASPATGSPLTIPTVTQARLGSDGANYFNGWLKKVNYWPMRVTNSETQAFSK